MRVRVNYFDTNRQDVVSVSFIASTAVEGVTLQKFHSTLKSPISSSTLVFTKGNTVTFTLTMEDLILRVGNLTKGLEDALL